VVYVHYASQLSPNPSNKRATLDRYARTTETFVQYATQQSTKLCYVSCHVLVQYYKISFRRRASADANSFKMSSVVGVLSRCDCISTRASTLSSAMLRIAVAVLSSLLNTRSGSAVDTGSDAKICSRVLIFVALTRLQSSYSCFYFSCFFVAFPLVFPYCELNL